MKLSLTDKKNRQIKYPENFLAAYFFFKNCNVFTSCIANACSSFCNFHIVMLFSKFYGHSLQSVHKLPARSYFFWFFLSLLFAVSYCKYIISICKLTKSFQVSNFDDWKSIHYNFFFDILISDEKRN